MWQAIFFFSHIYVIVNCWVPLFAEVGCWVPNSSASTRTYKFWPPFNTCIYQFTIPSQTPDFLLHIHTSTRRARAVLQALLLTLLQNQLLINSCKWAIWKLHIFYLQKPITTLAYRCLSTLSYTPTGCISRRPFTWWPGLEPR